MALVRKVTDRECPKKSWGWEEWVVNNDLYCGKRLHFTVMDGQTSLHFHSKKHETMFVERGVFDVMIVATPTGTPEMFRMTKGDSIEIKPNVPHRIIGREIGSCMVEFSTHHDDMDSYRVFP